jgi:hypothetical protein
MRDHHCAPIRANSAVLAAGLTLVGSMKAWMDVATCVGHHVLRMPAIPLTAVGSPSDASHGLAASMCNAWRSLEKKIRPPSRQRVMGWRTTASGLSKEEGCSSKGGQGRQKDAHGLNQHTSGSGLTNAVAPPLVVPGPSAATRFEREAASPRSKTATVVQAARAAPSKRPSKPAAQRRPAAAPHRQSKPPVKGGPLTSPSQNLQPRGDQPLKQAAAKARTEKLRGALQQLRAAKALPAASHAPVPAPVEALPLQPTSPFSAAVLATPAQAAVLATPTQAPCVAAAADSDPEDILDEISLQLLSRLRRQPGEVRHAAARQALQGALADEEVPLGCARVRGEHTWNPLHVHAAPWLRQQRPLQPAPLAHSAAAAAEGGRSEHLCSALQGPSFMASLCPQCGEQRACLAADSAAHQPFRAGPPRDARLAAGVTVGPHRHRLAASELVVTRAPSRPAQPPEHAWSVGGALRGPTIAAHAAARTPAHPVGACAARLAALMAAEPPRCAGLRPCADASLQADSRHPAVEAMHRPGSAWSQQPPVQGLAESYMHRGPGRPGSSHLQAQMQEGDARASNGLPWAPRRPLQPAARAAVASMAASAGRPAAYGDPLGTGGDILEAWRSRRRQAAQALLQPMAVPSMSTAERYSRYLAAQRQQGACQQLPPAAAHGMGMQQCKAAAGLVPSSALDSNRLPLQPARGPQAAGVGPIGFQPAADGSGDILERWRARRRQMAAARGALASQPDEKPVADAGGLRSSVQSAGSQPVDRQQLPPGTLAGPEAAVSGTASEQQSTRGIAQLPGRAAPDSSPPPTGAEPGAGQAGEQAQPVGQALPLGDGKGGATLSEGATDSEMPDADCRKGADNLTAQALDPGAVLEPIDPAAGAAAGAPVDALVAVAAGLAFGLTQGAELRPGNGVDGASEAAAQSPSRPPSAASSGRATPRSMSLRDR